MWNVKYEEVLETLFFFILFLAQETLSVQRFGRKGHDRLGLKITAPCSERRVNRDADTMTPPLGAKLDLHSFKLAGTSVYSWRLAYLRAVSP